MPSRKIRNRKNSTRKMGGRKGNKGSRKNRSGGLRWTLGKTPTEGGVPTKELPWNSDFNAVRKEKLMTVYELLWNAKEGFLILDFRKLNSMILRITNLAYSIQPILGEISENAAANIDKIGGKDAISNDTIIVISVSKLGTIFSAILMKVKNKEDPPDIYQLMNKNMEKNMPDADADAMLVDNSGGWINIKKKLNDLYNQGKLVITE